MKSKKLMQKMTEDAKTVAWPTLPDDRYTRFVGNLKTLIHDNIGYSEMKTLEYDECTNHAFYFTAKGRCGIGSLVCVAKKTFTINPKLDIVSEMTRVIAEVDEFKRQCIKSQAQTLAELNKLTEETPS